MEERLTYLRKKAMKLPLSPGVYLMRDKSRNIIYVGKSKVLRNRVSNYFGSQNAHNDKVKKMVDNVFDFEYILTDSEFEALILECSLIKQHAPKYNILLKDDKGYHYIKITNESWPRISAEKQKLNDDAIYLGPYTSAWTVKKSVDEALKIFKLPSCNRKFPNDINKSRPCLNYYIKQCCAPCIGKVTEKEYNSYINDALEFLRGSKSFSIKKLTKDMKEASENLEFERAAKIRDRISAIKRLADKQKVISTSIKDQDVIALGKTDDMLCFEVFRFENGRLSDREEFFADNIGDDVRSRTEFLEQYYSIRDKIPKVIAVDGEFEAKESVEMWLSKKAKKSVKFIFPKKGDQLKIIEMCKNNAMESLAQRMNRTGKEASALEELKQILNLEKVPSYIEAYDISNLSGKENVAGMVVFENARPLKSAYRRFKIKGFEGQDDYESMREVITRRLDEYKNSTKEDGFGRLPDLILLDGGKGHVSAIRPILERFNLSIPVYGMVKDDKHHTRAIAADGSEVAINSSRQVFTLISRIQEEVHRFSINYHRNLRKKSNVYTSLTDIDGVGEKRAMILLKHFKTIDNIKHASIDELLLVKGITKGAAKSVYEYFNGK